jgi:hypothetical protein
LSRIGPRAPMPIGLLPRRSIDQLCGANTRHGPGGHWFARVSEDTADHDHLREPTDAVEYLDRHRVPLPTETPSKRQLDQLGVIRDMIRGLLDPARPAWSKEGLAILASTRFAAGDDGTIQSVGIGWNAFIGDLMLPLIQLVEARESLRLCGNAYCRLIFLDSSRNHSRRWCDTSGCGNRDRVRRYRGSRATPAARGPV